MTTSNLLIINYKQKYYTEITEIYYIYYNILYSTILYYTILYYHILYCTILYYTILYYIILYYNILWDKDHIVTVECLWYQAQLKNFVTQGRKAFWMNAFDRCSKNSIEIFKAFYREAWKWHEEPQFTLIVYLVAEADVDHHQQHPVSVPRLNPLPSFSHYKWDP